MRTVLYVLSLMLLTAVGCFPQQTAKGPTNAGPLPPPRLAPAVTPDEVTEQNAHQKSQALREEIEQAQRDLPTGRVAVPEAPRR
ncbi:MAG TPA: hypothetical protein VEL76_33575 [Gemmataceae bacterium]|nr:hypothetical protein [Gemmataceae bacterium]